MSISAPASPQAQLAPGVPEAAGPMDDLDPYNTMTRPVIGRISRHDRPADPDEAVNHDPYATERCNHCAGIPEELLASLQQALAGQPKGKRIR
jgi:hypothetical protein